MPGAENHCLYDTSLRIPIPFSTYVQEQALRGMSYVVRLIFPPFSLLFPPSPSGTDSLSLLYRSRRMSRSRKASPASSAVA